MRINRRGGALVKLIYATVYYPLLLFNIAMVSLQLRYDEGDTIMVTQDVCITEKKEKENPLVL